MAEGKKKFPSSFKTVEIMQDCSYGFTVEFVTRLVSDWSSVKDYAFIVHDKDFKADGSPREPHVHLMLRFHDSVPVKNILSKLEGVCEVQHLQKMKAWNSAIAYLTHETLDAKMSGKHRYNDNEVVSNFEWQADRDTYVKNAIDIKMLIEQVLNGEIREYNYAKKIPGYAYVLHRSKFDNAWKHRSDLLQSEANDSNEDGGNSVYILWLWGPAGNGKTEFAKYQCRSKGLDFYISGSGSDPLGDYKGQPAIILDDVRPSNFDPATLVKLLDPNTRSTVKSRYRNKWLEVEWIFITCPMSPEAWWQEYRYTYPDAGGVEQLTRRINQGSWELSRVSSVVRLYDDKGSDLGVFDSELPADFLAQFSSKSMTADDKLAEIQNNVFGITLKKRDTDGVQLSVNKDDNDDSLPF